MNYIQYLSKLEHRKYKRFTQSIVETLEEIQNLLYKDEHEKAIESINNLVNGFKTHWESFEQLSEDKRKVYENLAKEILAEIGSEKIAGGTGQNQFGGTS